MVEQALHQLVVLVEQRDQQRGTEHGAAQIEHLLLRKGVLVSRRFRHRDRAPTWEKLVPCRGLAQGFLVHDVRVRALVQEQAGDLRAAALARGVQGGPAIGRGGVEVRALGKQQFDQGLVAVSGGEVERFAAAGGVVWLGAMVEQEGGGLHPAFLRRIGQRGVEGGRNALARDGVEQIRAVLDQFLHVGQFVGLLGGDGGHGRDGGVGGRVSGHGGGTRYGNAQGGEAFAAGPGERVIAGELREDALIERRGLGLVALLVANFRQPENRRRCHRASGVVLLDDRRVVGGGVAEVAVGFLLEQAIAQEGGGVLRSRGRR